MELTSETMTPVVQDPMVQLTVMEKQLDLDIRREESEWNKQMRMAEQIAESGLFGFKTVAQVITMQAICREEKCSELAAMRRYDVIEGKPSMKASTMQSDFEETGGRILWHVRSDDMVAATFFKSGHPLDDASKERATKRFKAVWTLLAAEPEKKSSLMMQIADLATEGEETIVRTLDDAINKGLALGKEGQIKKNWKESSRQMLTARVITEGVRIIEPRLISGMYDPDELSGTQEPPAPKAAKAPKTADELALGIVHLREVARNENNLQKRQGIYGQIAELKIDLEEMDDNIPGIGPDTAVPVAYDESWKDVVINNCPSDKFLGKPVGSFDVTELEILQKWYLKNADKKGVFVGFRPEQEAINEALESLNPPLTNEPDKTKPE